MSDVCRFSLLRCHQLTSRQDNNDKCERSFPHLFVLSNSAIAVNPALQEKPGFFLAKNF